MSNETEITRWESIDQWHTITKYLRKYASNFSSPITWEGTVKLHGTNAGVERTESGEFLPQSRNRRLTPDSDNFGFASFVSRAKSFLPDIWDAINPEATVIFGEWIGPGVQKKVAISELPKRQWVIFGAKDKDGNLLAIDKDVSHMRGHDAVAASIYEAPTWSITVEPWSEQSILEATERLTELTLEVERQCPWAKLWGIEGVGEGIVWAPQGEHFGDSRLYFKTKGEAHKGSSSKTTRIRSAPLSGEDKTALSKFLEEYVTPYRCEQVLSETCDDSAVLQNTGRFIGGMCKDVQKESLADVESLGLEWKKVSKHVGARARDMWMSYVRSGQWTS